MKRFWWFSCEGVQFVRLNTHGVLVPYGMFTAQLFVDQNRMCVFCDTLAPHFRPNHIILLDGNSNRAVGWEMGTISYRSMLQYCVPFFETYSTSITVPYVLAFSFIIYGSQYHHIWVRELETKKSVINPVTINFTEGYYLKSQKYRQKKFP